MSIIIRLILLLIVLGAAPLQATAAILTMPMPAITLNQPAQQQEGALLKTLVLPASAAEKLTRGFLSLRRAPYGMPAAVFTKRPWRGWV